MELRQTIDLARRVHNRIFDDIVSGKYPPGAQLPAAREIAAEHRVGYCTAVQAVRMLREEGIIDCHAGRRARVLSTARPHCRIGIVLDNARIGAPLFSYATCHSGWILHNAVQLALMKRRLPAVTLAPGSVFADYLGHLDGLILIRHTDTPWNLPLYPELPAVNICNQVPPEPWFNSVCIDRRAALTRMAIFFVTRGVRQFWMVANRNRLEWDEPVRAVLREHGIDDCRRFVERSLFGHGVKKRFAREILPELRLPAAFFASGDFQARELTVQLSGAGLCPKKDFFVIGGTGLPESAHWTPSPSVIATPFWSLAETAAEMLGQCLQKPRSELPLRTIPARLVWRKT